MKKNNLLMYLSVIIFLVSFKVQAQENDFKTQLAYIDEQSVLKSEMSKEEEEKLLKAVPAEVRQKLEEIKKIDKKKYTHLLRNYNFGFVGWTTQLDDSFSLKKDSSKEKELEIDVELLVLKYKNGDDNNKAKLKTDLNAKLAELFDLKEVKKQEEVKRLEKRLQELKESLQLRKQNKGEIVNKRIQELLGDSKYLRWE